MRFSRSLLLGCCLVGLLLLPGCWHGEQVRHLSSDVCLLLPGQMTQKDVLAYLGEPNQRRADAEGRMVWLYYEVRKSTMRKTPFLGKRLGYEEYDVVTITFAGDTMQACVYRSLDEKEFAEAGIAEGNKKQDM
ncbi:MAG: hypothetical protein OEV73_02020 [Desulfobulbaceae bacterium]|nr:hypothetical protein [Desulfobulbaceae bacterium]